VIRDFRFAVSGIWIGDFELGSFGFWILDCGYLISDFRFWIFDYYWLLSASRSMVADR